MERFVGLALIILGGCHPTNGGSASKLSVPRVRAHAPTGAPDAPIATHCLAPHRFIPLINAPMAASGLRTDDGTLLLIAFSDLNTHSTALEAYGSDETLRWSVSWPGLTTRVRLLRLRTASGEHLLVATWDEDRLRLRVLRPDGTVLSDARQTATWSTVHIVDMNGDDIDEVAVVQPSGLETWTVHDGAWSRKMRFAFDSPPRSGHLALFDIDADGDEDLVGGGWIAKRGPEGFSAMTRSEDGFSPLPVFREFPGYLFSQRDAYGRSFGVSRPGGELRVFSSAVATPLRDPFAARDGDGGSWILDAHSVLALSKDGELSFRPRTGFQTIGAADLDGDGGTEVFSADYNGLFVTQGLPRSLSDKNPFHAFGASLVLDDDADGTDDLVQRVHGRAVRVLSVSDDGSFGQRRRQSTSELPWSEATDPPRSLRADLDGDGVLERVSIESHDTFGSQIEVEFGEGPDPSKTLTTPGVYFPRGLAALRLLPGQAQQVLIQSVHCGLLSIADDGELIVVPQDFPCHNSAVGDFDGDGLDDITLVGQSPALIPGSSCVRERVEFGTQRHHLPGPPAGRSTHSESLTEAPRGRGRPSPRTLRWSR